MPACPVCRKPAVPAYRPFCSKRCADVDLGRWLNEAYVAPGIDGEAEEALADGAHAASAGDAEDGAAI